MVASMKRAILLGIVLLASCKKGAPSSSTPPPGDGDSFDERQACTADTDCVAVEIECCDHCNGGVVVGIHRDHAAEVRNSYAGPDECGQTACTLMACIEQPTAVCRQGVCGLQIGDRQDTPALPPP